LVLLGRPGGHCVKSQAGWAAAYATICRARPADSAWGPPMDEL